MQYTVKVKLLNMCVCSGVFDFLPAKVSMWTGLASLML